MAYVIRRFSKQKPNFKKSSEKYIATKHDTIIFSISDWKSDSFFAISKRKFPFAVAFS